MDPMVNPIEVNVSNDNKYVEILTDRSIEFLTNVGYSAYDIARLNGFQGTVQEWLASLAVSSQSIVYIFGPGQTHSINFSELNNINRPKSVLFYNPILRNISISYFVDSDTIYIESNVDLNEHIMVIS